MGKKSTVVVKRIKRHRAPGADLPPVRVSHYGNGWNGQIRKPANQPQSVQK